MYKREYSRMAKNKEKLQLVSNFLSLISLKGIDFLIPLLILPYLVRTLGMENFGLISFSLSISIYFGSIMHYGFSITAVRDIARVRHNQDELSKMYSIFISTIIVLIIVSLLIFIILVTFIASLNEFWILHLYSFYFVAMQSLFPAWFFQGMEKMKYIAYINLSTKILFLLSLWLVVTRPDDYIFVPLLNGIMMMISVIISFWIIHKDFKIKFYTPSVSEIKNILIEGRHAFIVQFSPTLYNNTATFLLGYTASNTIVGIYASATKLIDAFNSLAVLLSNTFLPYLSRNIQKHLKFSQIMIGAGIVLTGIAFFFSDALIILFFSKENLIIAQYFKLLTPMILFIFIRFAYGPNYLMLIGKEKVYKNIVLYTCLLFFAIALYLIPQFGIYGSIGIMLGASFLMAMLTTVAYKKINKNEKGLR